MRVALVAFTEFDADDLQHAVAKLAHYFAAVAAEGSATCDVVFDDSGVIVLDATQLTTPFKTRIGGLIEEADALRA